MGAARLPVAHPILVRHGSFATRGAPIWDAPRVPWPPFYSRGPKNTRGAPHNGAPRVAKYPWRAIIGCATGKGGHPCQPGPNISVAHHLSQCATGKLLPVTN